jgi:hypothetical protein
MTINFYINHLSYYNYYLCLQPNILKSDTDFIF